MSDCATTGLRFEIPTPLALEAAFDGGRLTSDGGLFLWLSRIDSEMGLCQRISECVPEWRNRRGRHPLCSLLRQRAFQIAAGYEDHNDSDALREDPLLKVVCGSLPESGQDLASQPTICRMENAATIRSCHRIAQILFELYLSERGKNGPPRRVLLDFDATDDPTHGEQEGSYYHGYPYGQHMYHPLLVFDGESGHLVTALLRAGNTHASRSSVAILKRIVCGLRERWPEVQIEIRADAGFAIPALYDYCEREGGPDDPDALPSVATRRRHRTAHSRRQMYGTTTRPVSASSPSRARSRLSNWGWNELSTPGGPPWRCRSSLPTFSAVPIYRGAARRAAARPEQARVRAIVSRITSEGWRESRRGRLRRRGRGTQRCRVGMPGVRCPARRGAHSPPPSCRPLDASLPASSRRASRPSHAWT
jgi:DDE family transposase